MGSVVLPPNVEGTTFLSKDEIDIDIIPLIIPLLQICTKLTLKTGIPPHYTNKAALWKPFLDRSMSLLPIIIGN